MWGYLCEDCVEYNKENELEAKKHGKFRCKPMRIYVSPKEHSCNVHFKKRNNNCYITTAMCHILGEEDNCETLETLRSFRDNYMKKHEEYLPLLEDYKTVGPMIADKLYDDENCFWVAKTMKNNFIDLALDAIEYKEYDSAVNIYENMTYFLMDFYDIDYSLLSDQRTGIQRKRELINNND
jgi:hypothetical protein